MLLILIETKTVSSGSGRRLNCCYQSGARVAAQLPEVLKTGSEATAYCSGWLDWQTSSSRQNYQNA
jgi:hypothetical protein